MKDGNGTDHQVHSDTLSVIVLSHFSELRLESTCKTLIASLEAESIPFEIVLMDDGSTDNSFGIACELERRDSRIRAYRLSKNYTSPYSQFAGMSVSRGACAVTVPDDLQRPPELVVQMYRKWQEGHKIVIAHRSSRDDGLFNDFFSNLYYRIMNAFSDIQYPQGGADAFLADREVLNILTDRIHPIHTSTVAEVLRLGFDPYYLPYARPPAVGKSRWTLKKKVRLAMDTFFASSNFPIRLIIWIGLVTFVSCLFLVGVLVLARLFSDKTLFGFPIQGWTTIMVFMTMFNGLILLCMGIVAEYVWRTFEEVKNRPGYIIRQRSGDENSEPQQPEPDHRP